MEYEVGARSAEVQKFSCHPHVSCPSQLCKQKDMSNDNDTLNLCSKEWNLCIHFVLDSFFIVNLLSPHVQPHILFSWFDITILAEQQEKGKTDSTLVLLRRYFHALFSYQLIFSFESNLCQLFSIYFIYRQVPKLLSKTFMTTR